MDLKLKRRAVYTGLRPFLSDKALQQTLQMWHEEYAQDTSYAFTDFLSAFCDTEALKKKRTRILSSLLRAVESPENDLLPDPLDSKTGKIVVQNNDAATETANNNTSVFVRLVETLLQQCDQKKANQIRKYALEYVQSSEIELLQKHKFEAWLNQSEQSLKGGFEMSSLRQVINAIYVALCEYFGPVKADQMLAQAVSETEAFAVDQKIKIHDLL